MRMIKIFRKKQRTIRLRRSEKLSVQVFITTVLAIAIGFTLVPFLLTLINSLKTSIQVQKNIFSLPLWGSFMWSNYKDAFSYVGANIWNSVFIAFVQSAVLVVISAVMAYIFAEVDFFGSDLLFYIYILVMLLPNELNTPENYAFVYRANLLNTYWAVWLPGWSSAQASGIFLFRIFFMGQPKSLKEAARIDGANNVQLFSHIVLPMTIPIVIYRFLTSFTGAYNSYLWNTLVLQDQAKMSVITLLMLKSGVVKDNAKQGYGVLYAMYIISGLPLMAVSAVSLKFFKGTEFSAALKM